MKPVSSRQAPRKGMGAQDSELGHLSTFINAKLRLEKLKEYNTEMTEPLQPLNYFSAIFFSLIFSQSQLPILQHRTIGGGDTGASGH
jgi:hypothetical protein